jgi:hypothetical protein
VIADQQWRTVQEEEQQNETLLCLSNEILGLIKEIHTATRAAEAVLAVEFGAPSPSYGNSFRTESASLLQPCDRNCCRIGGVIADGGLLNWMLPAHAALARR